MEHKEYVRRIPEWCISIALMEDGVLVCGGICGRFRPMKCSTGPTSSVVLQKIVPPSGRMDGERRVGDVLVLASRSEVARGSGNDFRTEIFACSRWGSVAYKLALVAAEKADATWTLAKKRVGCRGRRRALAHS